MSPWSYGLLALAGFAASVLNVIAGGGSFLTLPLLIFLGLPAVEANGTNRLGVMTQNIGAVWGFHRHRVLDWRWALASLPATGVGTLLGAWLALHVADRDFRRILAAMMLVFTLGTLLRRAPAADPATRLRSPWSPPVQLGFLAVGLYGGFVQAGVGFLVLALTTLCGMDLVRGNAIKVFAILVLALLSLLVFAWDGRVDWPAGLALAAGSLAGGVAGVHLAVLKGQRWLERAVTATVIVFALLLWFR